MIQLLIFFPDFNSTLSIYECRYTIENKFLEIWSSFEHSVEYRK